MLLIRLGVLLLGVALIINDEVGRESHLLRVQVLLLSSTMALCGPCRLPMMAVKCFHGRLCSSDLSRRLRVLPVRVGNVQIEVGDIGTLHRLVRPIVILLVILQVLMALEAHHLVLVLLAGGTEVALILHGKVTQWVALRVEGRHVVHVGAQRVGVLAASAEVHLWLAGLRMEKWIGVGVASVVVAVCASHVLRLESVRRSAVLVLREEPCLGVGLVVELGVEFQVRHLGLEALVFVHHV